jgi:hypothetical protein
MGDGGSWALMTAVLSKGKTKAPPPWELRRQAYLWVSTLMHKVGIIGFILNR